jgi:phosphocarrier protein
MIEKTITVKFEKGLHARPVALLVGMLSNYKTTSFKIIDEQMEIDAKSIMGILLLAATCGTQLHFVIEGEDEVEAAEKIVEFFDSSYEDE